MLILCMKRNECVIWQTADGPVTVTLLEMRGGQARVGFDAPKSVGIWREKVLKRLEAKEASE